MVAELISTWHTTVRHEHCSPSNYHTLHERHLAASGNTNRCLIKDMRKTEGDALHYSNDGDNICNCAVTREAALQISMKLNRRPRY
jgi:hypothetical protein